MSTHNTSAALRKCRGCGKVYAEDAPHPCTGGSDSYTAGMTIEEARRIYGSTDGKSPGVKAAEEADRVQLVEALAEHPGTPWGEAIEKVAALRAEHAARGAVIDGLRASLATVTRERDEAWQYIPAAQSCHRLADYMSTNRDLLEYDGCDMAGDGAIDVLGRLARERDELRAALAVANEYALLLATDGMTGAFREQILKATSAGLAVGSL